MLAHVEHTSKLRQNQVLFNGLFNNKKGTPKTESDM